MRFSCALIFCCKAELDLLIEGAGVVLSSGAEQGGTIVHPQLNAINTISPEPYKHDLCIAYPPVPSVISLHGSYSTDRIQRHLVSHRVLRQELITCTGCNNSGSLRWKMQAVCVA